MKTKSLILLFFGISRLVFGQVQVPGTPQWEITLHVTDQAGGPIANATATASYYIPQPAGTGETGSHAMATTDTNGLATLSAHSGPVVICLAQKAGYYSSSTLSFHFKDKSGDEWQPWNPMGNLLLKQIMNPIPMYAKWIRSKPFHIKKTGNAPTFFNKIFAYDLTAGDWVAPLGKGEHSDIIFTEDFHKESQLDYEDKLTVGFSNAGDGIQQYIVPDNEKYSGLRSSYESPADGYQSQIVKLDASHPGQSPVFEYDENAVYFFRVRTILDENGNVKSALYGKIYGDFVNFQYYLNPTPNDRNVEFDLKRNLFDGLEPLEQVKTP